MRSVDREPSNLRRTIHASAWMYSARALAFGWALLLTYRFGIHEYGSYAIAFAVGATIALPLDSYFTVRAPRVSDGLFASERTTRLFLGLALVFAGWLTWPFTFIGGFAIGKAGVDLCFQASRSHMIRDGFADRAQRSDAIRQLIGIGIGTAYVLLYPGATLAVAALLYLAGTALPVIAGASNLAVHQPSRPEFTRRSGIIFFESTGSILYVHAEVILLAIVMSQSAAGYYSFGSTILWSLAAAGQSFAYTFHAELRSSGGKAESGPPIRTALLLAAGGGLAMAAVAAGLFVIDARRELWLTFAILALVSPLRTMSHVATVFLVMQHRDIFRMVVTWASVLVKVPLILLFSGLGAPGAALAFLASDLVMSGSYMAATYLRERWAST
jgi:O-antigen/teichoic acid export membrane protein